MKSGIELVTDERREHVEKHGRTVEHDVKVNNDAQLRIAAIRLIGDRGEYLGPPGWDKKIWNKMCQKPTKQRLIIAASLLIAEIDRLQAIEE